MINSVFYVKTDFSNYLQIIIGDGKGMVNYVYFVLAGECKLIEHMIVRERKFKRETRFNIYNPEAQGMRHRKKEKSLKSQEVTKDIGKIEQDEWGVS